MLYNYNKCYNDKTFLISMLILPIVMERALSYVRPPHRKRATLLETGRPLHRKTYFIGNCIQAYNPLHRKMRLHWKWNSNLKFTKYVCLWEELYCSMY